MANLITSTTRDRGIRSMFPANASAALMQAGVEVSDPGYARQPVEWEAAGDGAIVNAGNLYFPAFHVAVTTAVDGRALYDRDELLAMCDLGPYWRQPGDVIQLLAGRVRVALA